MEGSKNAAWGLVERAGRAGFPVVILLGINIVVSLMSLFLASMVEDPSSSRPPSDSLLLLSALGLLLLASTGVFFFIWLVRSINATKALNRGLFPYSTAFAVGSYFIPIIGLFRPYEIMRETFRRSVPQTESFRASIRMLLVGWWLTWIGSNFMTAMSSEKQDTMGIMVGALFSSTSAGFLICLVRALAALQRKKCAELPETVSEGFTGYPRTPEAMTNP